MWIWRYQQRLWAYDRINNNWWQNYDKILKLPKIENQIAPKELPPFPKFIWLCHKPIIAVDIFKFTRAFSIQITFYWQLCIVPFIYSKPKSEFAIYSCGSKLLDSHYRQRWPSLSTTWRRSRSVRRQIWPYPLKAYDRVTNYSIIILWKVVIWKKY